MTTYISSQSFRNDSIVQEKIDNQDFEVFVSPEFVVDGETFAVVLDGHHSHQAAIEAGVEPEYIEQDDRDNDNIALLEHGVDAFLEAVFDDTDWHDINTGRSAF